MDVYIHGADGSIHEFPGLPGHLNAEKNLERIGYKVFDVPIPSGDYGDGELIAVRSNDSEYGDSEYDVAEITE